MDGLRWVYRNGFDRILKTVPAAAWIQPEQQGWEKIKKNGRREVWRATIAGAPFYLKYYFRHGAGARIKKLLGKCACSAEWNGGIYALEAGIPAVAPAGYAVNVRRDGRLCELLVTEAVQRAEPLNEFWLRMQGDADHRRRRADTQHLTEVLAEMIARAHQAGFEHLDMHAANILVQPVAPRKYRTVLVDLHSARMGAPLRDSAVVRNLAQLNQWFKRNASVPQRMRFLRSYLRWRNEFEHAFPHARPLELSFRPLVRDLTRAAGQQAARIWGKRDRRIRRDGSYFTPLKLGHGWRGMAMVRCKHANAGSRASAMIFEPRWWRSMLADPLKWFAPENSASCKDSHSAQVRRAVFVHESDTLPVMIKRPLARNARRKLTQTLARSRSLRGWNTGHALLNRDLPTARPIAFLERRIGPMVRDNLLITEAVPGAVDLETHLRQALPAAATPRELHAWKRPLIADLARHLRAFHERGFIHRDCKAGNILAAPPTNGAGRAELLWIDMDGIRLAYPPFARRDVTGGSDELRALMRLHVSLIEVAGLTRTDRIRFLKHYLARYGARRGEWKAIWRIIAPQTARKLAQMQARRDWKIAHYGRP